MGSLKILKSIWPSTWGSKISLLRYLRADETVDIDTALQEILVICYQKTGKLHRNLPTQQLLSRLRVQRSQLILFWDVRERKSKSTPTKHEHCERIMSYDCPLSKAFKTLYFLLAGMDSHEHWHHSESRFAIVIFKFSSFGKDISILIHFQM